jgi:hypothetical protein
MSKINRHMSRAVRTGALNSVARPAADNAACGTVQGALKGWHSEDRICSDAQVRRSSQGTPEVAEW